MTPRCLAAFSVWRRPSCWRLEPVVAAAERTLPGASHGRNRPVQRLLLPPSRRSAAPAELTAAEFTRPHRSDIRTPSSHTHPGGATVGAPGSRPSVAASVASLLATWHRNLSSCSVNAF